MQQQYFLNIFPFFQKLFLDVQKKGKAFLYFDFDGTLAPIVPNPENVKVSRDVIENLEKLASLDSILVGIVSGRELKFMRRHLKSERIFFVGSHGSEMSYKDLFISRDEMLTTARRIHKKVKEYLNLINKNPGAIIESKKFGVALHYRLCELAGKKNIRRIARKIAAQLPDAKVTILRGKQVAEINPKIGWTKGRAIEEIRKMFPVKNSFELYIGDDISDETAFAVLNLRDQYTVRIRKRKDSRAKFFLYSQKEVKLVLEQLANF